MGTYIPNKLLPSSYELDNLTFDDNIVDSHTVIALQTALELNLTDLYFVGYDGYSGAHISEKEQELYNENNHLFKLARLKGMKLSSLTLTKYSELISDSVYSKF